MPYFYLAVKICYDIPILSYDADKEFMFYVQTLSYDTQAKNVYYYEQYLCYQNV